MEVSVIRRPYYHAQGQLGFMPAETEYHSKYGVFPQGYREKLVLLRGEQRGNIIAEKPPADTRPTWPTWSSANILVALDSQTGPLVCTSPSWRMEEHGGRNWLYFVNTLNGGWTPQTRGFGCEDDRSCEDAHVRRVQDYTIIGLFGSLLRRCRAAGLDGGADGIGDREQQRAGTDHCGLWGSGDGYYIILRSFLN
ncbi:hypothetical protein QTP88_010276 [Uroleucon formosanum]